jgi:GAF domain-containing protein
VERVTAEGVGFEPTRSVTRPSGFQDSHQQRCHLNFFEIVHDEESACGTALAAGKPVWVPEVASSPIFAGTPSLDVMLDAGSRAVASMPVRAEDGHVIAMISVHCHQPTAWTEQQRQQLAAVAAVTGRLLYTPGQALGSPSPVDIRGV